MNDSGFKPGETVWVFLGETLVSFQVKEVLPCGRLLGENKDESFCMWESSCYSNPKNAINGMKIYLKALDQMKRYI